MDNPTTLLVAIMFVTIIVTGLVSILMFLSDLVAVKIKFAPVHQSWVLLLLLAYMIFFWQTTLILEIEGWTFVSFFGFILGPVALLFATNLLLTVPENSEPEGLRAHFLELSPRFFLLLGFVQLWTVLLDVYFDSTGLLTWLAGLMGGVFVILALVRNYKIQAYGAVLAWLVLLTRMALQSL